MRNESVEVSKNGTKLKIKGIGDGYEIIKITDINTEQFVKAKARTYMTSNEREYYRDGGTSGKSYRSGSRGSSRGGGSFGGGGASRRW